MPPGVAPDRGGPPPTQGGPPSAKPAQGGPPASGKPPAKGRPGAPQGKPGAARGRPPAGSSAPAGQRKGRSAVRAQLRQVERLRMITLVCVTLVLLGALPGFFLIRYATRDPAFRAMDALEVPSWAARHPVDEAVGSRWCIRTCRVRQRLWESDRPIEPTLGAYRTALRDAGWKHWSVTDCPVRNVRGNYSCWRRDAYTLDLWIRAPQCRRNGGGGAAETGGANRCPASLVTLVIRNAGADYRLK